MEAYSCFPLFLIFTILQRVIQLTRYDSPRPPTQKRPRLSLASPRNVLAWYRNINLFPFPGLTVMSPVKVDLPWPDERWPGTLAPSADRIPTGLCCYSYQDSRYCPVHRTSQPCFGPNNTPRYRITLFRVPLGIGSRFSPVHFHRAKTRRVNCYAFLRGWLFLSLPPPCLRPCTDFL